MSKILLIEDTLELAKAIQRELAEEGHMVTLAADGQTGIDSFQKTTPDLVILDWMLPRLDGLSVLRRIRAESDVPVLMLSARGEAMDRVIGLEVGADDYLAKPFSSRELMARVHALLRRMAMIEKTIAQDRQPATEKRTYGPLSLNPATRTALLKDKPLDLSRLEFDLLALFLANPGRVFSRAYLIETIWDETYLPGSRSVDNAILRLRGKLGPLEDAIETVWGVGYRLRQQP
jgi:DNA-binding response OmpR family regulator